MSDSSDERYFRMHISLGYINSNREIIIGPIPDSAVGKRGFVDREYWIDTLWEYLEVSFKEVDEETAKAERGW